MSRHTEARAVSYFMHREVGLPIVSANGWDEAPLGHLMATGLAGYMDSPCVASSVSASGFRIGLRQIYPASDASVDAGPDDIRSQEPR